MNNEFYNNGVTPTPVPPQDPFTPNQQPVQAQPQLAPTPQVAPAPVVDQAAQYQQPMPQYQQPVQQPVQQQYQQPMAPTPAEIAAPPVGASAVTAQTFAYDAQTPQPMMQQQTVPVQQFPGPPADVLQLASPPMEGVIPINNKSKNNSLTKIIIGVVAVVAVIAVIVLISTQGSNGPSFSTDGGRALTCKYLDEEDDKIEELQYIYVVKDGKVTKAIIYVREEFENENMTAEKWAEEAKELCEDSVGNSCSVKYSYSPKKRTYQATRTGEELDEINQYLDSSVTDEELLKELKDQMDNAFGSFMTCEY